MPQAEAAKTDVTAELLASLEQAVAMVQGTMAPGRVHRVEVPEVDVLAARQRLGMSQPEFAGVALPTLRKWEQRQRRPQGPARALAQKE